MADNEESKRGHCNEPGEMKETYIPMQVDIGEDSPVKILM